MYQKLFVILFTITLLMFQTQITFGTYAKDQTVMVSASIPVEAELGAVMGHEDGPLPPYEEIFSSGKGFTDADEAINLFVKRDSVFEPDAKRHELYCEKYEIYQQLYPALKPVVDKL